MQLLFGAQIEQKRALLQLPIPTPQGASLSTQPVARGLPNFEPKSGTDMLEDLEQVHAEQRPRRRAGWLNVSALLALGSLGAFSGILAGKLLGGSSTESADTPAIEPAIAEARGENGRIAVLEGEIETLRQELRELRQQFLDLKSQLE